MLDDADQSARSRDTSAPTSQASSGKTIQFGNFLLDCKRGKLFKGNLPVRLHPQPMEVLRALLDTPGEVVSRQALQQRIWPTGTHVEFDTALNTAVRSLRAVLGDTAVSARYIETLPRRGYRFIAPARFGDPVGSGPEAVEPTSVFADMPLPAVVAPTAPSEGYQPRRPYLRIRSRLAFGVGGMAWLLVLWIELNHFTMSAGAKRGRRAPRGPCFAVE